MSFSGLRQGNLFAAGKRKILALVFKTEKILDHRCLQEHDDFLFLTVLILEVNVEVNGKGRESGLCNS